MAMTDCGAKFEVNSDQIRDICVLNNERLQKALPLDIIILALLEQVRELRRVGVGSFFTFIIGCVAVCEC